MDPGLVVMITVGAVFGTAGCFLIYFFIYSVYENKKRVKRLEEKLEALEK